MQNLTSALRQIRRIRRALSTSSYLSPEQKIEKFQGELQTRLEEVNPIASARINSAIGALGEPLKRGDTTLAYSLATRCLSAGEVSASVVHGVKRDMHWASDKVPLSKDDASTSLVSCAVRMYCTFVKEAVEEGKRDVPSASVTSAIAEGSQRKLSK